MSTLRLFRGITVPSATAQDVIRSIYADGLSGTEGDSKFQIPDIADVRQRLEFLFTKPDLRLNDFFALTPFPGICACGTHSGAAYYATRHNFSLDKNDYSVAIEFTASIDDVYVDPRDFLCTAFQLWDQQSVSNREWQAGVLRELFGPEIIRYFSSVCLSSEQSYRIAISNLASFDPDVVQSHYANKKVIAGRYNTRFSSAFLVRAPIEVARISRVYSPKEFELEPEDISLSAFLNGSNEGVS
jgi:hypothetical protein